MDVMEVLCSYQRLQYKYHSVVIHVSSFFEQNRYRFPDLIRQFLKQTPVFLKKNERNDEKNVKKIHVGFNIYVQTNMCIQYAYKTIQNMFKKIRHGTYMSYKKKEASNTKRGKKGQR